MRTRNFRFEQCSRRLDPSTIFKKSCNASNCTLVKVKSCLASASSALALHYIRCLTWYVTRSLLSGPSEACCVMVGLTLSRMDNRSVLELQERSILAADPIDTRNLIWVNVLPTCPRVGPGHRYPWK